MGGGGGGGGDSDVADRKKKQTEAAANEDARGSKADAEAARRRPTHSCANAPTCSAREHELRPRRSDNVEGGVARPPRRRCFRKCARCRAARYCSRECQLQHWRDGGHQHECRELLASAASAAAASAAPQRSVPAGGKGGGGGGGGGDIGTARLSAAAYDLD